MKPAESKKYNNICLKCAKPLTIGVLNRVAELADRPEGVKPANAIPYKSMIALEEIIADALGMRVAAKKVRAEYENIIKHFGNEFSVLLDVNVKDIERVASLKIAEGISRVREGKVHIAPGYDGEYGKIEIFPKRESKHSLSQPTLFS